MVKGYRSKSFPPDRLSPFPGNRVFHITAQALDGGEGKFPEEILGMSIVKMKPDIGRQVPRPALSGIGGVKGHNQNENFLSGKPRPVGGELQLEEVVCPLCDASAGIPIHREASFQMVKCRSCQFIYLNPRPTNGALHEFYQTYLPEGKASIESWQKMMEPVFKRAARLLQRFRRKGRLIDVGTGFGFFLSEMQKRGWEVAGVEISRSGLNYARDRLALNVFAGPLEKADLPEDHYDAVTAFYVIEHLPRPTTFVKECYRILKPGGLLLLRYPHTTPIKNLLRFLSIENRLYDLPAHLCDFSPETIQRLLERVGFNSCKHFIGGYTLPDNVGKRLSSAFFGNLSEGLFYLSGKKCLFPGVSKTVLAFKRGSG